PMMQAIPGGATAKPFKTHHNALNMDLYLRIAPELYLKRLLVGGFERVFELNRNFRNEGVSTQHNPEFTMLEFYQAYATYEDLMELSEELFRLIAMEVNEGRMVLEYQGDVIDLSPPWARYSFMESLTGIGEVPQGVVDNFDEAVAFARSVGLGIERFEGHGKLLTRIFDLVVEPRLIQPTFIYRYPIEVSPLSRKTEGAPGFVDRFELFIAGREMANAFSELNDPRDQRERFMGQLEAFRAGDEEAHQIDEDYIRALEYAMPPAAGEGIGIDRLVMLFTDSPSIRDVILFPHMRPEKKSQYEIKGFELFISMRYLLAKRRQTFVSLITLISIAGVGVGVTALIVVLAVMNGFDDDLRGRILGITSHVNITSFAGTISNYREVMGEIEQEKGVVGATPFIYAPVMVTSGRSAGAVLRGIDPLSASKVIEIQKN